MKPRIGLALLLCLAAAEAVRAEDLTYRFEPDVVLVYRYRIDGRDGSVAIRPIEAPDGDEQPLGLVDPTHERTLPVRIGIFG